MNVEQEALRAAGLPDYGARAYAALVRLGPSPAAAVAAAGNVPPTKVYVVLAELERRGWVESDAGRPKQFRAKSPRACLEREEARLTGLFSAAIPLLEADYREHTERHASPFWVLNGDEKAGDRSVEMVRRARRDVALLAAFPIPADGDALPRAAKRALARGARVRVLAPIRHPELRDAFRSAGADVREGDTPIRLLVVDGGQVLVSYLVPHDAGGLAVTSIWHPSTEVARLLGSAVPHMWDSAAPPERG